jgi:hypothetical protein
MPAGAGSDVRRSVPVVAYASPDWLLRNAAETDRYDLNIPISGVVALVSVS